MKRFTKTLLSVAAVSAVSAAMAVSAMAADMSASYAGDTVTLSDVKSTGAQQTLLILNGAETVVENEDGSNNIVQIDQKDDGTVFATTKVGTLKDGTYYVRVGGSDGTLQKYTLTVSSTPEVKTKIIVIGDTDGNNVLTGNDAVQILRYEVDEEPIEGTKGTGDAGTVMALADGSGTVTIGDTDGNSVLTGNDAVQILRYEVDEEPIEGNKGTGKAGSTATVVVK